MHRLLAASLALAPLPESARDRAGVHALTDNLNTRHRNAQMAGRASVELHTLIFFKDRTITADARVTRVSQQCLSDISANVVTVLCSEAILVPYGVLYYCLFNNIPCYDVT